MRVGSGPRRSLSSGLFAIAIASVHCAAAPSPAHEAAPPLESSVAEVGDGRLRMGTILDITLLGHDEAALRSHLEWAFTRVSELEAVASRHLADSDLSRFNRAAGERPLAGYAPELRDLLEHSVEAGKRTGGAFDVTIGPLIELWWGAAQRNEWPGEAAIAEARDRVGYQQIILAEDGRVGLASEGRSVDFGGIGKGYALDVVRAGLALRGVEHALLDFGGSSVWAMGRAADGGPWLFELDAGESRQPPRVLALEDQALSVSSSLGDSSMIGARVVGHAIDPRTGMTINAKRTAVAVGRSATWAEVWSTALLVLEAEDGRTRSEQDASIETWVRFESGETTSTAGFERVWSRPAR